jgi:hypothetical protein
MHPIGESAAGPGAVGPAPSGRGPGARRRARAIALGLGLAVVYAAGAWVSGSLSPTARAPILDGAGTLPYRWVHPPPDLATGNQQPTSGSFTIRFRKGTSEPGPFSTNDQQVHVILSEGAIPHEDAATAVHLTEDPLDPATLGRKPGYSILGNAVRIAATYQPGGQPVGSLAKPAVVALTYPAIVTHSLRHLLLTSEDGHTWTVLKTSDDLSILSATAQVRSFGFFAVGVRGGLPSPPPSSGGGGGRSPLPWIVIGVAAAIAIGLVVTRGGTTPPRGEHARRGVRPRGPTPRGRGGRHERPSGGGRRRSR